MLRRADTALVRQIGVYEFIDAAFERLLHEGHSVIGVPGWLKR